MPSIGHSTLKAVYADWVEACGKECDDWGIQDYGGNTDQEDSTDPPGPKQWFNQTWVDEQKKVTVAFPTPTL